MQITFDSFAHCAIPARIVVQLSFSSFVMNISVYRPVFNNSK